MRVGELAPAVVKRIQFTLRYQMQVPSEPGCYVLTTFEGDILYVGLSDELRRRFGNHRGNDEKCEATSLGKAFWFYYLEQAEKDLNRLERSWMNQYVALHGDYPVLNKVASPVR
jgi:excinuclease UvrABC nuclease subunit